MNIGDKLYRNFKVYFDNLSPSKKEGVYDAPKAFPLPEPPQRVSSFKQFLVQVRRNALLTGRNRDSKMVDFTITIIAVLVLNVVMGVSPDLLGQSPTFYWPLFIASKQEASSILQLVFQGAIQWASQIQIYTLAVGLVVSILIGLNAVSCSYYCCLLCIPTLLISKEFCAQVKIITANRLEFFREANSGISVSAFFLAATLTTFIEQGFTALIGGIISYLLMETRK